MAAEGRGNTILTRALQLVPGPSKLLGIQDLLSPLSFQETGHEMFFLHLSSFSLPILMRPLFTSFIVALNEAMRPHSKSKRRAYETRLRTFRFRSSVIHHKK